MAEPVRPPHRLAAGWSIIRLEGGAVRIVRYLPGGTTDHLDVPGIAWVDAELAVAAPPGAHEADEMLVRHELERIHFGRARR